MANTKKSTLKTVFEYIRRYIPLMLLSVFFSGITVAMTLYIPVLIGRAIDYIIGEGAVDFSGVMPPLFLAGGLTAATALLQWISGLINNRVAYSVVRDIRNDAFCKIEALPLKVIDSHSYGEIISRVIADADQFSDGLLMGFTQLFSGIVTILGTLIFMFSINPWIAVAVVVLTPLSLLATKFIASKTYSMFKKQSEIRGEQTAFIDEIIVNQKVVKAFSYEKRALRRFDDINARLEKYSLRAIFFSSVTNPATRFINSLVYACVALLGAFSVIGGGMSVGGLSCFLSYANQYTKPFNEISGVVTELQNALACAARIFELINEPSEVADSKNILEKPAGKIDIENVCFSYDLEKKLIENFNLHADGGAKIAIVGPTGCGKTTLINLLMRFYEINGGSIKIDGTDIRDVSRHSLRKNIGMVLQETYIVNGTVSENIAIGKPDASKEEILTAAKAAHAHSFIKRLPEGYDTILTDGGSGLSQGEKQLLCIARIMLCMPPILILDEATSSIDTRTEMKIQDGFEKLMKGRTSFIVAHRLSTVRDADVILVMRNGSIIEQGTHNELLLKNGFYSKLYNSQFAK